MKSVLWSKSSEWKDKLCRQHGLFKTRVDRREQGAPLKVGRIGQWFPLFAVLENCVRCFPV